MRRAFQGAKNRGTVGEPSAHCLTFLGLAQQCSLPVAAGSLAARSIVRSRSSLDSYQLDPWLPLDHFFFLHSKNATVCIDFLGKNKLFCYGMYSCPLKKVHWILKKSIDFEKKFIEFENSSPNSKIVHWIRKSSLIFKKSSSIFKKKVHWYWK